MAAPPLHHGVPQGRLTVTVTPEVRNGTTFTLVRASLPYRVLTLSLFNNLEVTISGNAMMRNETSN